MIITNSRSITMTKDRWHAVLRRICLGSMILVAVAWMTGSPAYADDDGNNEPEIIHALLPTVVNISVSKYKAPRPSASRGNEAMSETKPSQDIKGYVGSGFVIDPSGLVVTNYHVVEDAFKITVSFSDGARLPAKMLSASRIADLALLKVTADHPLPAAHWGNSGKLQVGDQVLAAGDPFGIGLTITAGIVSALNRNIHDSPYDDFIQTDAMINHGNSGGPLFDMRGEVVGVDSDIISPTLGAVGLGFAIPSSTAEFVIDRLRTYGWIKAGWIGVKVQPVTQQIADAMGWTQPRGSIVSWVLADGPAKKAGLEIGDVILRYDGRTPEDDRALLRDIVATPVGQVVTMTIERDGKDLNLPIKIDAWPRDQWEAKDAPLAVQRPKITVPHNLGLSLGPLTAADRTKLSVAKGLDGVLVRSVAADTDAADRGIVSDDVILRVQNNAVGTPAEVWSAVDEARADKRDHVLMLVLPKVRKVPGPEWIALRLPVTPS
jgi:serine protease Do